MAPELTWLSMIAAAVYALVALACLLAAFSVGKAGVHSRHRRNWLLIAAFFAFLFFLRGLLIEDMAESLIRSALQSGGLYSSRRGLQALTAIVMIAAVLTGFSVWLFKRLRQARGRRGKAVLVAQCASIGMVLLVLVRLVSFHPIDALLYGPLKLNWIADLGLALIVTTSALYHRNVSNKSDV